MDGTTRALRLALLLNGGFLVVEAVLGFMTGSLALLADATHMLADVGAILLALAAIVIARRPAGVSSTFGQRRVQVLAGLVNALVLVVAGVLIGNAAVRRLIDGASGVEPLPVLIAGIVGLGINVLSAMYLHRHAHADDINARAALWHMIADALGSVGAIVAAILISVGIPGADAAVGLLIAVVVLVAAVRLARDAAAVLMQYAPAGMSCASIRASLLAVPGVVDVHDLHVWSVDGRSVVLTAHVHGPPLVRVEAEAVLREQFGITHTTLQIADPPCCSSSCALENGGGELAHGHTH